VKLEPEDRRALAAVRTDFVSIEDLRAYRFGSFDLGMAVLSSIVTLRRDPEPSLEEEASRIERLCLSSAAIYLSMKRRLSTGSIERVYAFNGRFGPSRAVLRACQDQGVDCFLHDRGSAIDRYALYENDLPHNVEIQEIKIRRAWEAAGDEGRRDEIADRFFESRARGICRNWISYVADQEQGRLPESWDSSRHNIVIFTSSEDEFVAIGDQWVNPLYKNQAVGIERVSRDLRGNVGIDCFIRLHPNLRGLSNQSIDDVLSFHGDNIHVVPPDSPVSSYALLKAADRVLTFGSMMGLEATYWGIPSILAGSSYYRNLGSTHNPTRHEDLMRMLTEDLKPADKLGAMMYGYYFATFGTPFVHFQAENLHDGLFRDKRVAPGPITYRIVVVLRSPMGAWPMVFLKKAAWLWSRWRLRTKTPGT
jgi:hypothetical protein